MTEIGLRVPGGCVLTAMSPLLGRDALEEPKEIFDAYSGEMGPDAKRIHENSGLVYWKLGLEPEQLDVHRSRETGGLEPLPVFGALATTDLSKGPAAMKLTSHV